LYATPSAEIFALLVEFRSVGKRKGAPTVIDIWSLEASRAFEVRGTSAAPFGVLDSGIQNEPLLQVHLVFRHGHEFLADPQPSLDEDPNDVSQVSRCVTFDPLLVHGFKVRTANLCTPVGHDKCPSHEPHLISECNKAPIQS
jgi:hypothetical protein